MSAGQDDLFDVYTRALDDWFKHGQNVVPICIAAGLAAMYAVSWLAAFASSLNVDPPPQHFAPTPTLKATPPAAGASPSKKVDAEADPREEDPPSFAAVAAEDVATNGGLKRRR